MNRFWGGLMIAAGVLVILLSGLCTLLFGAPLLMEGSEPAPLSSWLLLVISGGPPLVVGAGLVLLGHGIGWRTKSTPTPAARGGRRFVAVMMVVVGGLIGLSSVVSLIGAIFDNRLSGLVGFATLAIGAGLVWGGIALWRDPAVQPPTDVF